MRIAHIAPVRIDFERSKMSVYDQCYSLQQKRWQWYDGRKPLEIFDVWFEVDLSAFESWNTFQVKIVMLLSMKLSVCKEELALRILEACAGDALCS